MSLMLIVRDWLLFLMQRRRRLIRKGATLFAAATLSTLLLAFIATNFGLLLTNAYQAEMSVILDPMRRYENFFERLAEKDGEAATVPKKGVLHEVLSNLGGHGADWTGNLIDLGVLVASSTTDRRKLTFVVENEHRRVARALVEEAVLRFIENKNTAVADWVREYTRSVNSGHRTSFQIDPQKNPAETAAWLRSLSAATISFNDLANLGDSSLAIQLLLERAVLKSRTTSDDDLRAEQVTLRTEIDELDQQISEEIERLASTYDQLAILGRTGEQVASEDERTTTLDLVETVGSYAIASGPASVAEVWKLKRINLAAIVCVAFLGSFLAYVGISRGIQSASRHRRQKMSDFVKTSMLPDQLRLQRRLVGPTMPSKISTSKKRELPDRVLPRWTS